ncbi:MAG: gliding motility-associated C-terminal domain-containing protein [Verrucomicrobia bacterium]|nr:gliding motility-associated C-terminal domain-containing protein [Cytophagales bacterium]
MRIFLCFCFCMIMREGFGQSPCFTIRNSSGIEISRACINVPIQVQDCSGGGVNIKYDYNALPSGTDLPAITASTFTYPKAGTYRIRQWGSFNGTGDSTSKLITILPIPEPAFQISLCGNNRVNITITDQIYDQYQVADQNGVEVSAGRNSTVSFNYPDSSPLNITVTGLYNGILCGNSKTVAVQPIAVLPKPVINNISIDDKGFVIVRYPASSSFVYTLLARPLSGGAEQSYAIHPNPSQNVLTDTIKILPVGVAYIFRLKIKGNVICTDENFSEALPSLPITVNAVSGALVVNWQAFTGLGFQKYNLFRNDVFLTELNNQNLNNFTDRNVRCSQNYCYRLVLQIGNGSTSVSNKACSIAFSDQKPPAIDNLTASIDNGKVKLTWEKPLASVVSYSILRGATFQEIGNTLQTQFIDNQGFNNRVCYQITYEDSCKNQAGIGITACPMFLTLQKNLQPPLLEWTYYEGWARGVNEYTVENLDETGKLISTFNAGLNSQFALPELDVNNQVLQYRIKATQGSLVSYSNTVVYEQQARLSVPTAFSPDGIGNAENETFRAEGLFVKSFKLLIYNRWGQLIFASEKLENGWNGQINNQNAPPETYIYTIEASDFTGKPLNRNGTFVLIH